MDMSPERNQDYFCEGLAEELIDALTHVDGLRVAARSLSFQFRQDGVDLREVGRVLGVDAVVEGSVRRAGDQLRVTVQLIDVSTGYHKWSQRFERTFGDVFAIQDEIAASVATTLRGGAALSKREQRGLRRPQTSAEPYEYYLRGRQSLHRMRQPDLEQSRRMFEGAIELDADYAPAWAGLATVHALLYEWWGSKVEDLHRSDRASQIAMELAPDLADAHFARGFALSLHRRYDEAQVHFELASRINPHLFDAYYYYGRAAFAQGEIEHSVELFRKAGEVRQEDFQAPTFQAQSLRMLGREDEARVATRESVARAERIVALNPLDGRALAVGALALFSDGQVERALEWSQRAVDLYPDDLSAVLNAACLKLRCRQYEEGLDLLEQFFGRGWGKRDWVEHDPDYDCVREHPRFKAMFAKLK
jgi:TolB-like protein/tetratricopeptide (TPR) repeat protein